jgi:hypothetical protein
VGGSDVCPGGCSEGHAHMERVNEEITESVLLNFIIIPNPDK